MGPQTRRIHPLPGIPSWGQNLAHSLPHPKVSTQLRDCSLLPQRSCGAGWATRGLSQGLSSARSLRPLQWAVFSVPEAMGSEQLGCHQQEKPTTSGRGPHRKAGCSGVSSRSVALHRPQGPASETGSYSAKAWARGVRWPHSSPRTHQAPGEPSSLLRSGSICVGGAMAQPHQKGRQGWAFPGS